MADRRIWLVFLMLIIAVLAYIFMNEDDEPLTYKQNPNMIEKVKITSSTAKDAPPFSVNDQQQKNPISMVTVQAQAESDCLDAAEFYQSPEYESFLQWNIGLGHTYYSLVTLPGIKFTRRDHPYAYYNEEVLRKLAESGDPKAMQALGLNYIWQSLYEGKVSRKLTHHTADPGNDLNSIDHSRLEQGRELLYESAVHGNVFALYDMGNSIYEEIYWLKRNERFDEETFSQISDLITLYRSLAEMIVGDFEDAAEFAESDSESASWISADNKAVMIERLNAERMKFRQRRESAGLPSLKIQRPVVLSVVEKMERKLCKQGS